MAIKPDEALFKFKNLIGKIIYLKEEGKIGVLKSVKKENWRGRETIKIRMNYVFINTRFVINPTVVEDTIFMDSADTACEISKEEALKIIEKSYKSI